jgi:hypothetical protein
VSDLRSLDRGVNPERPDTFGRAKSDPLGMGDASRRIVRRRKPWLRKMQPEGTQLSLTT